MAARPGRPVFICQNCGYQAPKWLGRCPDCGAWSSMAEEMTPSAPVPEVNLPPRRSPAAADRAQGAPQSPAGERPDGIDRTLGGSVVHGSVVLLGGDPGIGKSTLMLQVLDRLCRHGDTGLYISGEESEPQIKLVRPPGTHLPGAPGGHGNLPGKYPQGRGRMPARLPGARLHPDPLHRHPARGPRAL